MNAGGGGTRGGGMGRKMDPDEFNASHHRQPRLAHEPSTFALLLLRARTDQQKTFTHRGHPHHPQHKKRKKEE